MENNQMQNQMQKLKLRLSNNLYNELTTHVLKTTLDNYKELQKSNPSISCMSGSMYRCTIMNDLYDVLIYMLDDMDIAIIKSLYNNYKDKLLYTLYQHYLKLDYASNNFDDLADMINEWIDKNITIVESEG